MSAQPDFRGHADLCEWHCVPSEPGYFSCEPRCDFYGGTNRIQADLAAARARIAALEAALGEVRRHIHTESLNEKYIDEVTAAVLLPKFEPQAETQEAG